MTMPTPKIEVKAKPVAKSMAIEQPVLSARRRVSLETFKRSVWASNSKGVVK